MRIKKRIAVIPLGLFVAGTTLLTGGPAGAATPAAAKTVAAVPAHAVSTVSATTMRPRRCHYRHGHNRDRHRRGRMVRVWIPGRYICRHRR